MRKEILDQLAKIKKDQRLVKQKTKETERKELEARFEGMGHETLKLSEKLLKLASQFDKELSDRDKLAKKAQSGIWDDI